MVNYLNRSGRGRSEGGKEGEKSGGGEVNGRIGRMGGKRGRYFFFFPSPTNSSQPPETTNMLICIETHIHTYCVFLCINMYVSPLLIFNGSLFHIFVYAAIACLGKLSLRVCTFFFFLTWVLCCVITWGISWTLDEYFILIFLLWS